MSDQDQASVVYAFQRLVDECRAQGVNVALHHSSFQLEYGERQWIPFDTIAECRAWLIGYQAHPENTKHKGEPK